MVKRDDHPTNEQFRTKHRIDNRIGSDRATEVEREIEQGLTSHQTHCRSYRGRVFTGQMTQPTVSKHYSCKKDNKRLTYDRTWRYLQWLKYNAAKPLLYTVYRTKKRKLGRKWSGKEISFEAVRENRECWSWGDVGRQTVPEAASSHRKRMIVNSGQPCSSDHQLWGRRRPETSSYKRKPGLNTRMGVIMVYRDWLYVAWTVEYF